jgi:streptogramin lyase
VFRIASDGSVSLVIDRPRHGLRRPNGLALDGKGNLFVADANTNAVFRVAASGEVVRIYDSKTAPQAARLRFPNGIGVDSAGNVYVAGNNSANVLRIEPDGATSEFIRARVDGRLLPAGAALVVSPDGTVFLARNGPGIWRASEPASAVRFLGRKVPGGFELTGPRNMLLDRRGRLLIAGVGTHNVLRVPPGLPAVSTQPVKPAAEETPEPAPAPGG